MAKKKLVTYHKSATGPEVKFDLALSTPMFEYWLLLHFEEGQGVSSGNECIQRLKQHCPPYDKKHLNIKALEEGIRAAVERAKRKDSPPCKDWPRTPGSIVYLLVEELLCG